MAALAAAMLLLLPQHGRAIALPDYSALFAQHEGEIRTCAAGARGSFAIMIVVSSMGTRLRRGHVQEASSPGLRRAGACLLSRAANWRFWRGSTTDGSGVYRVFVGDTIRIEKTGRGPVRRWRQPVGST